jgi:hypothetical protein
MVALRLATHDSGSGWFATPFLYDSFIHNSTPVYPGALRSLLDDKCAEIYRGHPLYTPPDLVQMVRKLVASPALS